MVHCACARGLRMWMVGCAWYDEKIARRIRRGERKMVAVQGLEPRTRGL